MSAGPPFLDLASKDGNTWYNSWPFAWGKTWVGEAPSRCDAFIEKWQLNRHGNPTLWVSDDDIILLYEDRQLIRICKKADTGTLYVNSFFQEVAPEDTKTARDYVKRLDRTMLGLLNDLIIFAQGQWFAGGVTATGSGTVILQDVWEGVVKESKRDGSFIIYKDIGRLQVQDAMVRASKVLLGRQIRQQYMTSKNKPLNLDGRDRAIFNDIKRRMGKLYNPPNVTAELKLIEPIMLFGYYGIILNIPITPDAYLDAVVRQILDKYNYDYYDEEKIAWMYLLRFSKKPARAQEKLAPLLEIPKIREAYTEALQRLTPKEMLQDHRREKRSFKLRWKVPDQIKGGFNDSAAT